GQNIEVVQTYKYLGALTDDKLDRSLNTDAFYKMGQRHLKFLWRLTSSDTRCTFDHTGVAIVFFYATNLSMLFLIGWEAEWSPRGQTEEAEAER
ncbi:hypothetical protein GOODEAATRI_019460, partial [Goodea atripinnis]